MSVNSLLSRLDAVRETRPGRWIARCPAHKDRRPSLAVRVLDDGRVLVHCFGGCGIDDVLGAAGLGISHLFPETVLGHRQTREPAAFDARDALRCLAGDAIFLLVVANAFARGEMLAETDQGRLAIVAARIQQAVDHVR